MSFKKYLSLFGLLAIMAPLVIAQEEAEDEDPKDGGAADPDPPELNLKLLISSLAVKACSAICSARMFLLTLVGPITTRQVGQDLRKKEIRQQPYKLNVNVSLPDF